jgi:threonyl-tRNA synthetase
MRVKKKKKTKINMKMCLTIDWFSDFIDLCRGPHVPSLRNLNDKAITLTKVGVSFALIA